MSLAAQDAQAFAESVAGVLDRHGDSDLTVRLDELGWASLATDPELCECAGLAGVELGRRLAPVAEVDRLLGAAPRVGELARSLGGDGLVLDATGPRRRVIASEPVASAGDLDVVRLLELGDPVDGEAVPWPTWIAASAGYLAGLGEGALELSTDYVRQRGAFGSTLAALAPVQQLLADAATLIRGLRMLAGSRPGADALAHSGEAATEACAACQQVTGAIGFTLEYPLHRFTQRARALATWNDALLEELLQPPSAR